MQRLDTKFQLILNELFSLQIVVERFERIGIFLHDSQLFERIQLNQATLYSIEQKLQQHQQNRHSFDIRTELFIVYRTRIICFQAAKETIINQLRKIQNMNHK